MARLVRKDILFWWNWTLVDWVKKCVAGTEMGKQKANPQGFHIGGLEGFFIGGIDWGQGDWTVLKHWPVGLLETRLGMNE
jgi:hypothetical protein